MISTGGGAGYRAGDAPPDGDQGPRQEEAEEEQDKIVSHQIVTFQPDIHSASPQPHLM